MRQTTFEASNEQDTRRLGAALALHAPDQTCLALIGTLGAGKTRLVQSIAEACGIDPTTVTSPTFVLCQVHVGRRTLYHLDAYRLADLDEFLELGVEEYFESPGLCLVEWADRVYQGLPTDCVEVKIDVTGPDQRRFLLTAHAPRHEQMLDQVRKLLETE